MLGVLRMAYNNQARTNSYSKPAAPVANKASGPREFKEDPNEVGIGYEKELKAGGTYMSFTVTKDIAAGTKVAVFANDKVKNRTEKTPTHKMKLSVRKQQA
jgi:hypothetical protein